MEFRYYGSSGTTVNTRAANLPSGDRCLDAGFPDAPTGSFMSFLTCLRIHFTPTGTGPGQTPYGPLRVLGNPCTGMLDLEVSLTEPGRVLLRVFSLSGGLVRESDCGFMGAGTSLLHMDLSGLPDGVYFAGVAGTAPEKFLLIGER